MSKKKLCIHCGSRNVEHACAICAKKNKKGKRENNICFNHAVLLDIGTTLELYSALGLNEFKKEHPSVVLCSCIKKGKLKGCAKKVMDALKKELRI